MTQQPAILLIQTLDAEQVSYDDMPPLSPLGGRSSPARDQVGALPFVAATISARMHSDGQAAWNMARARKRVWDASPASATVEKEADIDGPDLAPASPHPAQDRRRSKKKRRVERPGPEEVLTERGIEKMYEVERILSARLRRSDGVVEYLIKWAGYPSTAATWQSFTAEQMSRVRDAVGSFTRTIVDQVLRCGPIGLRNAPAGGSKQVVRVLGVTRSPRNYVISLRVQWRHADGRRSRTTWHEASEVYGMDVPKVHSFLRILSESYMSGPGQ
jgi:hypothetical protein